jgi:hypothetical protein
LHVVEIRENTMRSKGYLTIIITLIATLGLIGLVETVGAKPGKGKGPRVEDRTFFAEVYSPATGPNVVLFTTCYTFYVDGTWDDAYLEVAGHWIQDPKGTKGPTKGKRTSYTIAAGASGPGIESYVQSGGTTPAGGYLQLIADSTVYFTSGSRMPAHPLISSPADLVSIGWEEADCELNSLI